jgi:uncharacterized protein YidB (DUF937 family)
MGLLDILNGMQNGPRGPSKPGSGGMSPITMAILALLAYKAINKMSGGGPATAAPSGQTLPPSRNAAVDEGPTGGLGDLLQAGLGGLLGGGAAGSARSGGQAPAAPGGLGDLLQGGLGGLLGGGAAGSVLSGGLNELMKQFQNAGQGEIADSWVSRGPNKDISENDLAKSIGIDQIDALTRQTGLSRQELLSGLSRELPGVIDELTPDGRLPTEAELSRWV